MDSLAGFRKPARQIGQLAGAWAASFTSRASGRCRHRVLVNTLPKSGTTLVVKALEELAGLRQVRRGLTGQQVHPARSTELAVQVGVDSPVRGSAAWVRRRLRVLPPGSVTLAHLPYSSAGAELVRALAIRMVVVIRDPRDVATSLPPYIMGHPDHFLHGRFSAMDESSRFLAAVRGLDDAGQGDPVLLPLVDRMRSVVAWSRGSDALLIRFEDLVGPSGGGTRGAQIATLNRLADYLDVVIAEERLEQIADDLFGGTSTFRRGQIGSWREDLPVEHRTVFHRELTDMLIELGYEDGPDWG